MTAGGELRAAGVVGAVLARAEAWLLEPAQPALSDAPASPPRPVVAVRGLARGCGASTVARAVAATMAAADPRGAAVVAGDLGGAGMRLATPAAARLAREAAVLGCDGARAVGRLCLVPAGEPIALLAAERPCPVVIEVPARAPASDGLGLADHVVVVAGAGSEAALAAAVEGSLAAAGHSVDIVVNRVEEGAAGDLPPGATGLPEARLAAQVALACRGAHGPLAAPVASIAARCTARALR